MQGLTTAQHVHVYQFNNPVEIASATCSSSCTNKQPGGSLTLMLGARGVMTAPRNLPQTAASLSKQTWQSGDVDLPLWETALSTLLKKQVIVAPVLLTHTPICHL